MGKGKKKPSKVRHSKQPVKAKKQKRIKVKVTGTWKDYKGMEPQECQVEP